MFQHEMYTRQQILQSIISDGRHMIDDGHVDDRGEFDRKLSLLDDQWRSLVFRANQRKTLIDNSVSEWETYKSSVKTLAEKLGEIEQCLHGLESGVIPLERARALHGCILVSIVWFLGVYVA